MNSALLRLTCLLLCTVLAGGSAHAATMKYRDKLGREVSISVPVKRAVFFQTYELIPALGVWNEVVGIGRWAYDNDLIKAARPDIEKSVPSAGSGTDVNIEVLLKLKPDVVITWSIRPQTIRFMEEKGLKAIAIYPESLEELYEVMRLHGRLFGKEGQAEHSILQMEKIFALITERVAKVPAHKRKRVLWLGGKPTSVACGIGVTNDIFKLIGAFNPASVIPQKNADVPMERIIAWNPDTIFIWGNAHYRARDILDSAQWRLTRAGKEGRVYKAPEWSTWSPRLAPVALWMAMKTYPEYFRDIDLDRVTDDFYKTVFGISYDRVNRIE